MVHYSIANEASLIKKFFELCILGVLLTFLLASQSRGGLVLYLIGLYVISTNKYFKFGAIFSVILFGGLIFSGIFNTYLHQGRELVGTTGRLDIWLILLESMIDKPISLLIGNGPGSISFNRMGYVNSAHSMLITWFYWFGFFGVIFATYLFFVFKPALTKTTSLDLLKIKKVFFWMMISSFLIDSYILNAQILWFSSFIMGFALLGFKGSGRREFVGREVVSREVDLMS